MKNQKQKRQYVYLFIRTHDSMAIRIPASNYKEAEKSLNQKIKHENLGGDWNYDSKESI